MIISKDRIEKALLELSAWLSEDWESCGLLTFDLQEVKDRQTVENLISLNEMSSVDILELDKLIKRNYFWGDPRYSFLSQDEIFSLENSNNS